MHHLHFQYDDGTYETLEHEDVEETLDVVDRLLAAGVEVTFVPESVACLICGRFEGE